MKALSRKLRILLLTAVSLIGFSTTGFAILIDPTDNNVSPEARQAIIDKYFSPAEQLVLKEQMEGFTQFARAFDSVYTDVQNKMANNQNVDWDAVADSLGLPRSTPDDIYQRLQDVAAMNLAQDPNGTGLFNLPDSNNSWFDADWWMWHAASMYEDGNDPSRSGNSACTGKTLKQCYDIVNKDAKAVVDNYSKIVKKPIIKPTDMNGDGTDNPAASFFDISYMLSQIQAQIPALIRLVVAIAYLTGMIMIVIGIGKLKAYGHQTVMSSSHASFTPSLVDFAIGTILMFFPTMVQVGTNSVMTGGGDVAYSYNISTAGFGYANLFSAIIAIIHLVGYIAFLRGWLMLVRLGNHAQQGTLSKGIVHIIGGIMAINIITTWDVIKASFGFVW